MRSTAKARPKPKVKKEGAEQFELGPPPDRVWEAAVESLLASGVLRTAVSDVQPEEGLEIARLVGNSQEMALYILQSELEALWNGDAIPARRAEVAR
jgi:hypothetical protein